MKIYEIMGVDDQDHMDLLGVSDQHVVAEALIAPSSAQPAQAPTPLRPNQDRTG